jgi:hypothetical protein
MFGGNDQSEPDIFQTVMVANEVKNGGVKDEARDIIYRLDLELSTSEPKTTLYQAIDNLLWANDPKGDAEDEYYIDKVAPVLVMRVQNQHTANDAKGLGLQVPASFYADRYLKENYQLLREMRQSKEEVRQRIERIETRKKKLSQTPHPKDPTTMLEREQLFDKTVEYLRKRDKPAVAVAAKNAPKKDADEVMEGQEDPEIRTEWDDLADRLEGYHAKLKNKLKGIYTPHDTQLSERRVTNDCPQISTTIAPASNNK